MTSLVRLSIAGVQLRLWWPVLAGGLLRLPVDEEVAGVNPRFVAGRPSVIGSRGANQFKLVVALTLHEQFGINIAGIDNMLIW
jgi:hypothetical protein